MVEGLTGSSTRQFGDYGLSGVKLIKSLVGVERPRGDFDEVVVQKNVRHGVACWCAAQHGQLCRQREHGRYHRGNECAAAGLHL